MCLQSLLGGAGWDVHNYATKINFMPQNWIMCHIIPFWNIFADKTQFCATVMNDVKLRSFMFHMGMSPNILQTCSHAHALVYCSSLVFLCHINVHVWGVAAITWWQLHRKCSICLALIWTCNVKFLSHFPGAKELKPKDPRKISLARCDRRSD